MLASCKSLLAATLVQKALSDSGYRYGHRRPSLLWRLKHSLGRDDHCSEGFRVVHQDDSVGDNQGHPIALERIASV